MSGRKLNPTEQKLHQAALVDPKKTLSQKECDALVPDAAARLAAINFLLGTGLFKLLTDAKGRMSYRAVMKQEIDMKKDMSGEETMVLSHIQASGNEGIWTKHLKSKTELHQTVIDRCLKSLTQKQLVKAVKSVKYPTRKIFMLFHLEPSVEMTGGPWYTDNELDTEFIKLLCSACLRFIKDRSLPKQKTSEGSSSRTQPLYPIAAAPAYPTAQQVLTFLSKSRITETQLSVEHVEMLLNVLVLDGDIERVPAFGAALWAANLRHEPEDASDEEQDSRKSSRKRKRSKRSRDSNSDSDSDEGRERKSKNKRRKGDDSDGDEQDVSRKRKRKGRSAESDADDNEDDNRERTNGKKKSKRRRHDFSDSESETAPSDSDSDSRRRRKRKAKSRQRSSSPAGDLVGGSSGAVATEDDYGAYVYRAVKQEKIAFGLSQAPCVRCPAFDFCKSKGPVNPQECVYYEEWLGVAEIARE
ncbi:RNA polymerase Rpc34 subunit-domain-containing protein [Amylocystis lapponica]|nr:RNA polymerase Rpc34 subunit-domain-containing protein [Amylocystis lapponica]